jgi:hypothetical protein
MWGDRQSWRAAEEEIKQGDSPLASQQHVQPEEWHFIHALASAARNNFSPSEDFTLSDGVKFSPLHFITRTFDRDASAEFRRRLEILFRNIMCVHSSRNFASTLERWRKFAPQLSDNSSEINLEPSWHSLGVRVSPI